MQTLIALDIGTTGTKATLAAQDGRLLASGYAGYATYTNSGYRVEQEPNAWWQATRDALAQLRQKADPPAHDLVGITLSGQMQDLILIGTDGAIGRAILYSDTRAQHEAQEIASQIGGDELLRLTGNTQDASSLLAKWRWLQIHEADRLTAARTILLGAHSYIGWRLCGVASCDYTTASTTGLLNLHENVWATELLERVGLDAQKLPCLAAAHEHIGTLTTTAAQELMLPPDLPVFAGAGDLAAATVGVGAGEPNRSYCYLGTSGWIASTALDTVQPSAAGAENGIFTLRHPDQQRLIQVAPMLTAGGNLDWVRGEIAEGMDYATLNATAAMAPVGSNGVIYLPYLAGERSPFRDPDARACYIGISNQTVRADLIRAVMEGVCFGYRSLFEALGTTAQTLYVVGGGAKSTIWMQILADVLARDLQVVSQPENAAAHGAAIIAGRTLGWYETYAPPGLFPVAQSYEPRDSARATYEAQYGVFAALYPQLKSTFTDLLKPRSTD
ncbi:xylulokinase [Rhodococcus marinonascens]|uniref:xylulokinase n=1 Tax=Rhodococcus marinonascens TaxID=38311 RepID=UPI000934C671|nr:FGGY family carbohydrate kinase [Rhodococcus marinonascens]